MNLLRPDASHTTKFFETGKFRLLWNLSLMTGLIFGVLSIVFLVIDVVTFSLYFTMFLVSAFSLFYLNKHKRTKPVFWLYSIATSLILTCSLHSLDYLLPYENVLWTACLFGFVFIGLDRKYAILITIIHAISFVIFIQSSLNTNLNNVAPISSFNLILLSVKSALGFSVLLFLMLQYLKYQRYSYSELKKSKYKYRNIIENINDALIQDDVEGKIVFWNSKFLEMFGYKEEEMTNVHIIDNINEEYHEIIRTRHQKRILGEKIEDSNLLYKGVKKNGTPIWIELSVFPIYENGIIVGTQSLIRDVTIRVEQDNQLEKIYQELIKIEETERERIAYELHDGLNQLLVAARIHSDMGTDKNKVIEILDAALSESKNITQNLAPKELNEFGLTMALRFLSKKVEQSDKLKVIFSCDDDYKFNGLTENMQFNIYRIVQECFNNTVKHSGADLVQFSIFMEKNNLCMSYTNNGIRISDDQINNQNFLIAIKRRIKILKGSKEIVRNENGNVSFKFNIPVIYDERPILKAC